MSAFIHRFTLDEAVLSTWGSPTLSDHEQILVQRASGVGEAAGIENRRFQSFAQLRPQSMQDWVLTEVASYPTDTDIVLTLPVRTMKALSSLALGRAYVSTPTGTSVTFRAITSEAEFIWDGAAWDEAEAGEWSTVAELEAGLPSWPHKTLGFKVRLLTTKVTRTPKFYGILVGCEFNFRTAYSSADEDLPSSQLDDLLHRTVVGNIKSGPTFEAVSEFEATDDLTVIDVSPDSDSMDRKIDVTVITAVYDVTDDPERASALSGTWDSNEKTYTLDDSVPDGHVVHVEFTYQPSVAFTGDKDWFEESFPFIHVMGPDQTSVETPANPDTLVFPDGETVWVVPAPERHSYAFRLRFVAEYDDEVASMRESVRDWVSAGASLGGYGRTLLSEATALPVHIQWSDEIANLEKRGEGYEQHFRLVVQRWMYLHEAHTEPTATVFEIGE